MCSIMEFESVLSSPFTWFFTGASALYLIYWYGTSTFDYFTAQGIPGPKPLPYVGNLWGIWKMTLPKHDREIIKKYGKNVGWFDGKTPILWTTDVAIIKQVFVKDFEHFVNRRSFDINDKYFRKMIFIVKDQEWKEIRSSVTPAFTTGKIRRMSALVKECADRLAQKFEKLAKTEGKIEAKSELSAFAMDVIARCAFGMELKNLDGKNNQFMEHARQAFNPPAVKSPVIILPSLPVIIPCLMKFLSGRLFAQSFQHFIKILEDLIKERADSPEKYHDFVEVAKEAISKATVEVDGIKKPMWTGEEIDEILIAQCTIFLLAGFDTTGTTLTNTIFLLARHPEIQEKLHEDIEERLNSNTELKYEMNIPYLDQIIYETLRMYPAALRVERECSKDVTYNGVHIKKGLVVMVPTSALHYDENYYPEPEKFNPDRWDAGSLIKPNPTAYMPFGLGPRSCIGMRFAMEEMKIVLCILISKFRFSSLAETPETMEFEQGLSSVVQPTRVTVGIELRS